MSSILGISVVWAHAGGLGWDELLLIILPTVSAGVGIVLLIRHRIKNSALLGVDLVSPDLGVDTEVIADTEADVSKGTVTNVGANSNLVPHTKIDRN